MMDAAIILPTYNEADNIVELVHGIDRSMPSGWNYEIVIIDDNSPDHTFAIATRAFEGIRHVRPILRTSDRGLARSIADGIRATSASTLILMDTDFTHDPAEIPRMLHLIAITDVVVGSRFCAGGSMEDVRHYILSLVYNWFIRLILRTQIQDNLSGFICIRSDALARLPSDRIFFGYGDYCFRLLHFAQKRGLRVLEMPVKYRTRTKGKSKSVFWKLLFTYSMALFRTQRDASRDIKDV